MTKPNEAAAPTAAETPTEQIESSVLDGSVDDDFVEFFVDGEDGALDADTNESGSGDAVEPAVSGGEVVAPGATPSSNESAAAPATPAAPAAQPNAETPQTPAVAEAGKPAEGAAAASAPVATPAPVEGQPAQDPQAPTASGNESSQTAANDLLGSVREELNKNAETFTKVLAEQQYGITEEDARNVIEAPDKVLPQLAAKVHFNVVQNVLGTLASVLPGIVHAVNEATRVQNTMLDQFWAANPTLDRNADHQAVMQIAQVWRAQNPSGTFDDFTKTVGSIAMIQLGKVPPAGQAAAAPAQPAKAQALRPAGNSMPLAPPTAPNGQDFWAGFAESLADE